jgi:hypothetical protein
MKNIHRGLVIVLAILLSATKTTAQQVQYVPLLTDAEFDTRPIDQNKDIGTIKGYHGTTQTGAATYTMPIQNWGIVLNQFMIIFANRDRKSTRPNSSHSTRSRMPSSA